MQGACCVRICGVWCDSMLEMLNDMLWQVILGHERGCARLSTSKSDEYAAMYAVVMSCQLM